MEKFELVTAYNFIPEDHTWMQSVELQEQLVPKAVKGRFLFTVTKTLAEDGEYRGHSYVRCYSIGLSKPKAVVYDSR